MGDARGRTGQPRRAVREPDRAVNADIRTYGVVDGLRRRASHRLRFGGSFAFDDRRRNSDTLVTILAGFREYLWPYTLGRLAHLMPSGVDVCILSAGLRSAALASIAQRHGWSYLSPNALRISTVPNLAIR